MPQDTGTRILVVDDRPDVRLSFLYMLQALGFEVAEASDGAEALRVMAKQRIDVVLTDLYMPGMDGLALIAAIVKQGPRRPRIIAMTGSDHLGSHASLEAAGVIGADVVIRKPFSRDDLLASIRTAYKDAPERKPGTSGFLVALWSLSTALGYLACA